MTSVDAAARRPPLWWVLIRHEWRLTMRDFFNVASRKRRMASAVEEPTRPTGRKRTIAYYVMALIVLHVFGAVVLVFPRHWHDTAAARLVAVGVMAFLFTFMLSYSMSRIVTAFHERRDLDLLLSAPIAPMLILTIRALTVAVATTTTFAIFIFPIVDVGIASGRWWVARIYLLVPLLALTCTAIALALTDGVVRLVGVRRARVGLQIFSSLIGASIYLVTQARQFLPNDVTASLNAWFAGAIRVDDASWPVAFIAGLARGDGLPWLLLVVGSIGAFAAAVWQARRRFVAIAQTPEADARVVQPARTVVERRLATGFARTLFATLLIKEWRLILRAPQLLSQVLLQLLYLMPLMFVAFSRDGSRMTWGASALAAGVVGVTGTLATALAWLTVAAEDAPDLLAGSPKGRGVILSSKLVAAALPPILFVIAATLGLLQRSAFEAAVVLVYGVLACSSAAIIAAASPASGKRSDFQRRHRGRKLEGLIEALHFLLWSGAAGTAVGGYWIAATVLTLSALAIPALRLRPALRDINDIDG